MLAYFTVVKQLIGIGSTLSRFAIVLVCLAAVSGMGYAESGSSQAVMALIVPPHAMSLTPASHPDLAKLPQPYYNHEATVQITQQVGNNTRQIWVTF